MNTCSNCGAAVRPGAKFCTACGTRLNDAPASAATSEWTSGQRTESEATVNPASDAAGEADERASSHVEVRTVEIPQSPAPTPASDSSDAAPAPWSWRSSSLEPEPSPVPGDDDDATIVSESSEQPRVFQVEKRDTPSPSSATESTEEFTWTWSSSGNPDAEADTGTRTDSGNGIDPSEGASHPEVADGTPAASTSDEPAVDAAGHEEDAPATPAGAFWPSDDATSDTAIQRREADGAVGGASELEEEGPFQPREPSREPATENSAEPVVTSPQPAAISGDEDPLDRARRLIDELRTLIPPPRLYGEENQPPPAPPIPEGLREDLEAARLSTGFGELRSTLEAARTRPRDVDTILELVGRIDIMLEALDDRDRLAAAVDRAIDLLDAAASADGR